MATEGVTEQMVRNIIRQEQFSIKAKQDDLEGCIGNLAQQQESLKKENNFLRSEVDQLMLALQQEAKRLEKLIIVGQGKGSTRLKRTDSSSTAQKRHNPFNDSRTSKLYPDLRKETAERGHQNVRNSTISIAENERNLQSWWARNVCGPLKKKLGNAIDSFFEHVHLRSKMRHKSRRRRRQFEGTIPDSATRDSSAVVA
ncbi:uncharacterized protein [Branchiostoma lanceolatum]|uniref:uncharacterized protein isoform X1 n=1 Tax=Branchiostoma lanceolatum TaxID=7740 RepID=UPI0034566B6A